MSAPTDIGLPAPDGGPLEFSLQCRTSRTATTGKKHRVTIHPDWSVTTPHDLDAERVAAAFGGYTSCLELVERTIPVLREVLPLLTRAVRLPLREDAHGGWRLPLEEQAEGCCRGHRFATIATAASHARSVVHIAHRRAVPRWQLSALMAAAATAWSPWERDAPTTDQINALVRESDGVDELWRAGVHPRELPALAGAASAVHEPLPTAYFTGMVYTHADPLWMNEVLGYRPDPDTAAWLAWLDAPASTATAAEWGGWLRLGLSRAEVKLAVGAGLPSDRVPAIAATIGWSLGATARYVVRWARAGCFPTLAQFQELARHGVEHVEPSRGAIDALVNEVGFSSLDRTALAVMLATLGTRHEVLHALHQPDQPHERAS